ncbi:MAG: hypothetical protein NT103_01055 [Campylobacterales bacterium]|nr:hypothetical protein [Campylobacterales bacterium]
MKLLIWFVIFTFSLVAGDAKTDVNLHVVHGSILSSKIIIQAFNTIGQRVNIHRYENDGEMTHMEISLSGRKVFDPKYFNEILRDNALIITAGVVQDKKWTIKIDASSVLWQILAITPDEGVQMEKTVVPSWFVVNQSNALTIEAPYGNKWYPEIAVLDANMEVLSSLRSFKSQETMSFTLPEGAMYLKVANTNGMKLLKEGTWIENSKEN